jgi:mono/diheme cytochrome c family protein
VRTYNRRHKLILLLSSFCLMGACVNSSSTIDQEGLGLQVASVEAFMPERMRLIFKRSCESCHGIDGRGIAGIAPALRRDNHRSMDEWGRYLRESHKAHPVSQGPPLWLDDDEIKAVAEYLAIINHGKRT